MAGSGAGVNSIRGVLLDNITTTTAAITNPQAAYGNIGGNDSGGQFVEANGYTKWLIQLVPLTSTALVGYQFSVYDTISPNAYLTWEAAVQGATPYQPQSFPTLSVPNRPQIRLIQPGAVLGFSNITGFYPGVQPYEWVLSEAPSGQGGTGQIANPMTPAYPRMIINYPIDAIRVVLTTAGSAGVCRVVVKAVP